MSGEHEAAVLNAPCVPTGRYWDRAEAALMLQLAGW